MGEKHDYPKHLIVVLAHDNRACLEDMISNISYFCPSSDIAIYNSGSDKELTKNLGTKNVTPSRVLSYAKITRFFLDSFTWIAKTGHLYNYVTTLDSDVLFIKPNFVRYLEKKMATCDYLGQDLRRRIQTRPKWRPMRTLRPELANWYKFWGFSYANGVFNPGQTFSRKFISNIVSHPDYEELLRLVDLNRSFTLHEILLPTLVDFLRLKASSYPKSTNTCNRYRPYQAVTGIRRALSIENAYFVHPVRRICDDPARSYIRRLSEPAYTR